MGKIYFIITVCLIVFLACPVAMAHNSFYGFDYQYNLKSNRDHHKIHHGYYPYHFSNQLRSRYSFSGKEKGHYISGQTDKPWPFPKRADILQPVIVPKTDGIYVSKPSDEQIKALELRLKNLVEASKQRDVQPKVNATRDLERVIKQHQWKFDSVKMKDAILFKRDRVKDDPVDYDKLFQQ